MASGIINDTTPFGKHVKSTLMDINKTQAWLSEQTKIPPDRLSRMVRGVIEAPEKEQAVRAFLDSYMVALSTTD